MWRVEKVWKGCRSLWRMMWRKSGSGRGSASASGVRSAYVKSACERSDCEKSVNGESASCGNPLGTLISERQSKSWNVPLGRSRKGYV
jgi:hypothetical protein